MMPTRLFPLIALLFTVVFLPSCASTPKEFDWDAVPLVFSKEILERDFPGRIVELHPDGQIGHEGWSFDPEEPRYVCTMGEKLVLYDRFFGRLHAVDLQDKAAVQLLDVPRDEAKFVIGIDASVDGSLLAYTHAHFYRSDVPGPLKNSAFAGSAAFHGELLIAVNNPDASRIENRLLLELDRDGSILETFGEYNFDTTALGDKFNHNIRIRDNKAVVWNSDFAEISSVNLDAREQSLIKLEHPILQKRSRINGGEYFRGMDGGSMNMVLPVIVDMQLVDEGAFALISNEGIGMVAAISANGEIARIYAFPLFRADMALDFAVLQQERQLLFCVIVARGQRLSAQLYSAPAARE